MSNNKTNTTIEEIDLLELAIKILKKWYIFVIFGVLFVAIAIYHVFSTPSTYSTSGTVLIRSEKGIPSIMGIDASLASNFLDLGISSDVDNEKLIFQSKTLLNKLVTDLDLQTSSFYQKRLGGYHQLYNNEPIIIVFPENYKNTIKGSLTIDVKKTKESTWKIKFKHKWKLKTTKFKTEIKDLSTPVETIWGTFGFIEDATKIDPLYPNYKLRFITLSKKSRIDEYSDNIRIAISDKKANAISISTEGGSIIKNEAIVNKIIELYNQNNIEDKKHSSLETLNIIENRIKTIKNDLDIIDYKVEEYRVKNNLANLTTQAELIIESASTYEQTITEIEMGYTLVSFIENHILNSDTIELIPNTNIEDGTLVELISTYNADVVEYLRLKRSTNENNPFVSQLKNKILLTRNNILQTIKSTKEGLDIQKQDYIKRNREINKQISSIPVIEREFIELAQEQEIKRTIYIFLLQQYESIQTNLVSNSSSSRVIDYAYTSEQRISPRKSVSLFIAIFMAGLCGLIYIFLESLLGKKIVDKTQLSALLKNKIIASIPETKNNIISQNSDDSPNQAFRSLRTNLILNNNKIILITNSKDEENKTNIALNTSLSFTFLKKKVALIEVNPNNEGGIGFANYLNNTNKIEDIKQYYNDNNYLHIYPIGKSDINTSDLLASENFNKFINELQNEYDYIIINSTPIESDSFQILNKLANITLFVCTKNRTKKENIKYLETLISNQKVNNIAIIMNGVSENEII